jgi:hypothetical protein
MIGIANRGFLFLVGISAVVRASIYEGTSFMQLQTIAKVLLGR